MATDPSIPLQIRPPQVESPMTAFRDTASIADMLSQIQERRAQAAAIAEEAPLRRARLQAEQRQLAESQATNTAFDNSVSYDQEAGDVNIDEAKLAQSFQSQNMMHLLPGALQKKGEFLSKYRQQGLDETKQAIEAAKLIGGPITTFLALSDEEKKAEWPNLRPNVVAVHKPAGKTMGYTWDKDVIEPQLQAFKKDYETLQNVHDNLQQRTDEEKLRLTTAKGREQEIADQIREFTAQNGRPPDQEESDAIRNGVNEKAGYNAKITRKTPVRLQSKPGTLDGKPFNADFDPVSGKYTDPATGQDISGKFQPKEEAATEADKDFEDYLKHPELTSKYGADRTGFNKYKADQAATNKINVSVATQADPRLDRSYTLESTRLETAAKPVRDRLTRLQVIQDSLNQKSPQADALIAPELLTAMAGGQGSGLRMNEAEISRIVGGRDAWEDLKSRILRWQTDPTKPFLINDEQRKQIQNLIDTARTRVNDKLKAIDDAGDKLIEAKSPSEHRTIRQNAERAMDAPEGTATQPGAVRVQIPGHPPGTIPASALQQFLRDNPGAQQLQ